jgi:hypothetical protein
VGVVVAPLNITVLAPWVAPKFVPVMVTGMPTSAEAGDKLVMLGGPAGGGGGTLCPVVPTPPPQPLRHNRETMPATARRQTRFCATCMGETAPNNQNVRSCSMMLSHHCFQVFISVDVVLSYDADRTKISWLGPQSDPSTRQRKSGQKARVAATVRKASRRF